MKRYLLIFLLAIGFSSCYVYDEVRVSPHPNTFYYRWDPYYYQPRTTIIIPRRNVVIDRRHEDRKPNPPRIIEHQTPRNQGPHRIPAPQRTFPRGRH